MVRSYIHWFESSCRSSGDSHPCDEIALKYSRIDYKICSGFFGQFNNLTHDNPEIKLQIVDKDVQREVFSMLEFPHVCLCINIQESTQRYEVGNWFNGFHRFFLYVRLKIYAYKSFLCLATICTPLYINISVHPRIHHQKLLRIL